LGGGGDVLLDGQIGQKGFDFPAAHFVRMALVVEQNVAFDPVYISLFGANGTVSPVALSPGRPKHRVVFEPNDVTDLI